MKTTIEITQKELEAIQWAISMAEASYEGWSKEEIGKETIQDLKALARVEKKLWA